MGESLPNWFWTIYYIFLLATLVTAISGFKRMKGLSVIVIIFVVTAPIVGFINSIERGAGLTEIDFFLIQLQQGSLWTIYSIICYLFILAWWVMYLIKIMR